MQPLINPFPCSLSASAYSISEHHHQPRQSSSVLFVSAHAAAHGRASQTSPTRRDAPSGTGPRRSPPRGRVPDLVLLPCSFLAASASSLMRPQAGAPRRRATDRDRDDVRGQYCAGRQTARARSRRADLATQITRIRSWDSATYESHGICARVGIGNGKWQMANGNMATWQPGESSRAEQVGAQSESKVLGGSW